MSDTPLTDWQTHLAARGALVAIGPVPRTGGEGLILSLYPRDPDQNRIEITNRLD